MSDITFSFEKRPELAAASRWRPLCFVLFGTLQRTAWQAVFRASTIDAEGARAVRHDLEQTACHYHVLDEVKRLVGIGEVGVKEHRCGQAKQSKYGGDDARPIAHDDEEATADLDGDSSYISNGCGQGERRGL